MKTKKKAPVFERVAHFLLAPLARLLFRVEVVGKENIPAEGGVISAVNHISFCDVIVLSASFPRKRMPRYLAKAELFRIPLLRGLIRLFGAIPLDRGGRDVGAVRTAVATLKRGDVLSVFPQGTRQKGKNPATTPTKSGVAMIAARAQVPILPICLSMKNTRYAFMRKIRVIIGKPFSPEELGLLKETPNYREATDTVFAAICALGGYSCEVNE